MAYSEYRHVRRRRAFRVRFAPLPYSRQSNKVNVFNKLACSLASWLPEADPPARLPGGWSPGRPASPLIVLLADEGVELITRRQYLCSSRTCTPLAPNLFEQVNVLQLLNHYETDFGFSSPAGPTADDCTRNEWNVSSSLEPVITATREPNTRSLHFVV